MAKQLQVLLCKKTICAFKCANNTIRYTPKDTHKHDILVMTSCQIHHYLFQPITQFPSKSNSNQLLPVSCLFCYFWYLTGITRAQTNVNSIETIYHRYQNVNYLAIIFPHNIVRTSYKHTTKHNEEQKKTQIQTTIYLLLLFNRKKTKTKNKHQLKNDDDQINRLLLKKSLYKWLCGAVAQNDLCDSIAD